MPSAGQPRADQRRGPLGGGAVDEVELLWGPVRHGPGHTVALYLRDYTGNIVEFSSEEEVVLDDDAYEPRTWSAEDPTVLDEWGSLPPEGFL
ncbi:MAG TPA: hypothetical protein VLK58_18725 [Conexibacter sp.]|nr:hypothetical protein [Conexibacter sp.]